MLVPKLIHPKVGFDLRQIAVNLQDAVQKMGPEKKNKIFLVGFTDANIKQDTMMVEFMNAHITPIAMLHSNPFLESTLLA